MDHAITAARAGVRLRPVRMGDAEFILRLRRSSHAAGYIGDTATDRAAQEEWLKRYFERNDDYYFIVERVRDGLPVGTLGIYDVKGSVGEWGRWVIVPGVCAGPASAWLAFHTCFDTLDLKVVLGHVVESNRSVIAFHKRIGNPCAGLSSQRRVIGGKVISQLEYRATTADWPVISATLSRFAGMAESLL